MRRILFISGKAGAGKSALARAVHKLVVADGLSPIALKFADPLYSLHRVVYETMAEYGIELTTTIDRRLLQLLGTEWGRQTISDDVWVRCLRNRITAVMAHPQAIVLVDDVRFPNELSMESLHGICKVRLSADAAVRKIRAAKWTDTPHVSETALDDATGFDITLDTTFGDVMANAKEVYEWMKTH